MLQESQALIRFEREREHEPEHEREHEREHEHEKKPVATQSALEQFVYFTKTGIDNGEGSPARAR